jgi:hypothetical protein
VQLQGEELVDFVGKKLFFFAVSIPATTLLHLAA